MATGLGISRHELKIKHRQLVNIEKDLQRKCKQMRESLNKFAEDYYCSTEYNPWSRYTIWQNLVERVTAQSFLNSISQWKEESNMGSMGVLGPGSKLTDKIVTLDAAQTLQDNVAKSQGLVPGQGLGASEKRPLITGKPQTKKQQLFRKIKKMSGFCDEPIEDEDVLSNERLLAGMRTRERHIQLLHGQFSQVHASLDRLARDFECVRTQWCCCGGYCSLSRIIETSIEETEADTHYE